MTSPNVDPYRIEPIDDGLILAVQGEVDYSNSTALRGAIQNAVRQRPSRLIINLDRVPYMDSSGVAVLVEALQAQTRARSKLVVCHMQPKVKGIFEIARLDMVFKIAADLEAAKSL